MDNKGVNKYDLNKQCAVLAKEFDFASKLNSMARQSSSDRAWSAISRFYDNCQKKIKKRSASEGSRAANPAPETCARERAPRQGYPKLKKRNRSVEYKTTG